MKFLKLFFVLIFGIFAFVSCDNKAVDLENSNEFECIGFTKAELATVGVLHNQYLTEVYQKVDFLNCDDCSDEIIEAFSEKKIDLTEIDKSKEELIAETEVLYHDLEDIQFDLRNWSEDPFSSASYVHLTTIMEKIDEMENHNDFVIEMNALQLIVESDASLSCFDVELLTGTIEVAKNSALLWLSEENGGLNFGAITHKGRVEQRRWSWRGAVKADVAASAVYFTSMGVGLAVGLITPGTNVAILGMWGITASLSSALGGIG